MVRQQPVRRTREDMEDLLEQIQESLPSDCTTCLHDKPFSETVYNFDDYPVSQISQTTWKTIFYGPYRGDWIFRQTLKSD